MRKTALLMFSLFMGNVSAEAFAYSKIKKENSSVSFTFAVDGGSVSGTDGRTLYITKTQDGNPDVISFINTSTSSDAYIYLITDENGRILTTENESHDFDTAGVGICKVYGLSYTGSLSLRGKNVADPGLSSGDFSVSSNAIIVDRRSELPVEGGTLSGGPFEFCVDGEADMVSGLSLEGNIGSNSGYVITDDELNILGLPPTLEAVEGVDFDGAGGGTCLIWHISYEGDLEGAEVGMNAGDIKGNFDLSNSITVVRNAPVGGTITGGPFEFTVDGIPDMVSGLGLEGNSGSNSTWVITDDKLNILGLPPTLEAVEGVDFDGAGAGVCLIWHLSFEEGLQGAAVGNNAGDLEGCFNLSNSITVTRNEDTSGEVDGGTLSGGPFEFCVDGEADMVSGLSLEGNMGSNSGYVITDDELNILGLPPTLEAVEGVDFDGAGGGTCLIWHISYEGDLEGAEVGMNAGDIKGNFDLSNSITVVRNAPVGGTITGGPFEFTVDGIPDMVSGLGLEGNSGSNSTWVITDDKLNILGLPPTLEAVEGVDFDGAGAGVCLIWHLSFEDGLEGAEVGNNAGDLEGCFNLSNSITVTRNDDTTGDIDGGVLTGGPFEFCGDGMPDMAKDITLTGNSGPNSKFLITTESGIILGIARTLEQIERINFDRVWPGTYLLYHLSFDKVKGLKRGRNISGLSGDFDLSNSISITKKAIYASWLFARTQYFVVDGKPDYVKRIYAFYGKGDNSSYIITDDQGNILGLPPTLEDVKNVNFDEAGPGVCLIWNIRYEDGLQGLEVGKNANDLSGACFDLSNSIKVIRRAAKNLKSADLSENVMSSFKMYPTPASDVLNIQLDNASDAVVKVYDILGTMVATEKLQNVEKTSINVSTLSSGVYMLTVQDLSSGKMISKQFTVNR